MKKEKVVVPHNMNQVHLSLVRRMSMEKCTLIKIYLVGRMGDMRAYRLGTRDDLGLLRHRKKE